MNVFASDARSFKPLAVLRIGLGLILLLQAAVLWKYRELLLNEYGPVPWELSDAWVDPLLPKLSSLLAWLGPMGMSSDQLVTLVLSIHVLAAVFLTLGFKTRVFAVIAWLSFLPLRNTGFVFTYGLGAMLLIGLFYCMFMPVGRAWSWDRMALGNNPRHDEGEATFSVVVLRIHMCIIYAASGFTKALGEQWWTGDAVWRALSLPQFQQFDPAPLLGFPLLLQGAAIGAVLLQCAYPALVWTRLRAAVVAATELLHLGIAIFLGLWLFSAMMILLNTAAFGEALWKATGARWRKPGPLASWRPRPRSR